MRISAFVGAGVAGLGIVLTAGSSMATTVNAPPPTFGVPAQRAGRHAQRWQNERRLPSYAVPPEACNSNFSDPGYWFLGVNGISAQNWAGDIASAVLGGEANEACDQFTAIGAGYQNVISKGASDFRYSFIGGGYQNAIAAEGAFVGAGVSNEAALGRATFVGAGFGNLADGNGAFLGAGGTRYWGNSGAAAGGGNVAGGDDSFVGAGDLNQISMSGNGSFIGGGGYAYAATGATTVGNQISAADSFIGAGDNNSVTSSNAAIVGGQSNTTSATDSFVGSGLSNNESGSYDFIGAGSYNKIYSAAGNSAIAGGQLNAVSGGFYGFIGAGYGNKAKAQATFVGAGGGNIAGGQNAFVGAGNHNTASAPGSFIGGGGNATQGSVVTGTDSFVGAGDQNSVAGNEAFVGSGQGNIVATAATYAVVAGGHVNTATMPYAAVAGGTTNNATGVAAFVGGGSSSTAAGTYATIPGGYLNAADGVASFAAGSQAKARNNGAFVWSDNASNSELQSTANYQFMARASGGFFLYSNAAATTGVELAPNGGTWGSLSDRTLKTGVVPLDDAAVLDKVAALPVSEWSYTSERGVRHVGPMAQDFYAAFRVGEDDRHITSIDEDGVALSAIKALHHENARLRDALSDLRARDDARLSALEKQVAALTSEGKRGTARR